MKINGKGMVYRQDKLGKDDECAVRIIIRGLEEKATQRDVRMEGCRGAKDGWWIQRQEKVSEGKVGPKKKVD